MRKLSLILFIAVIFLSIFTIPGLTDNTSLDNKSLVDLSLKIQSLQKLNKAEKSKLQKKLLTYIYEDNVELKHILKELDNVKNEDYNAIINTFADSYKKKPVKNTSPDQNNVFNGEKEYTEKNIEGDIKGDLVIKKGENIIIKDESLKIDGKIVVETDASLKLVGNEIELNGNLNVRPYGNLLLDNTSLSIIHKYKGHREINTDKGSTIKIKDSTIKTKDSPGSGDWLHSNFEIRSNDNKLFQVIGSKIYARLMFDIRRDKDLNSRSYIKNSTVSSVRWNTTRKLSISDCKIGNLLLGFGGGKKETITIEGIKNKSKIKNFNLETNDGGRLNIKNIRLHKRLGTDFWARDRAVTRKEVIFRNCDLSLVQTKFPPTKDKIRIFNLPDPGYIEEFNLSKHIKGIKMPFNYIIEDCKVSGIKIEFWGTKAVIEDSFVMFHCQGGDVQTVVRDCTVLNHFNYGSENISFENVVFRDSMKYLTCQAPGMKVGGVTMDEGGDFNDTFKNCHANLSYIVVAMKKGYLSGGIKFNEITMNNVHWEKGQITRKFPIRIIDKKGNPYSGKKIVINNKKVKTDKNGEVVIEFNFNKDNYNKSREVIIKTQEGKKMIKNVDFITDTPIILYLELDYPLNDQQSLFKPTNDYKEEIKGVDVKGKTIYYFDGGKEDSYFRNIVESDFKNIKGFNYQRLDNYNQYKKEADIIILSSRIPYNKVPQEVREKIGEKKYHSLFETYTLIEVENTHIFIVSY